MKLSIYSIQQTIFEGEVLQVTAKTLQGEITVLEGHLPIITSLKGPTLEVVDKKKESHSFAVSSGFLEVRPESEVVALVG